jgi:hypothetical protein
MVLPQRFLGHRMGLTCAPHVIESFLDYTCPYSARFHTKLVKDVMPWVEANYPDQVQYVFCHQVQSWRPQATNMHEATLACERLDHTAFSAYTLNLFEHQHEFMDEAVCNLSRNDIYHKLAQYLPDRVDKEAFLKLLLIQEGEGKGKGNAVTDDLKWWLKYARGRDIHVSPTVMWDGITEPGKDSGTAVEEWKAWFKAKLDADKVQ